MQTVPFWAEVNVQIDRKQLEFLGLEFSTASTTEADASSEVRTIKHKRIAIQTTGLLRFKSLNLCS
jgi:hypothetical protein